MSTFDDQQVRDATPTAEGMFQLLCDLSAHLPSLPHRRLFLQRLVAEGRTIGITGALIAQISGSVLVTQEFDGFTPEEVSPFRMMPMFGALPLTDAARSGLPVLIGSREHLSQQYPALGAPPETADLSLASVPIERAGRVYGVLGIRFGCPVDFDAGLRAGLTAIAGLCASVHTSDTDQINHPDAIAERSLTVPAGNELTELFGRVEDLEKQLFEIRSLMAFASRAVAQHLEQ
jgi:GAF domain-containing protein